MQLQKKWKKTNIYAPTHARLSLPVNQKPNPAPPNLYPTGLHDTAATRIVVGNLLLE